MVWFPLELICVTKCFNKKVLVVLFPEEKQNTNTMFSKPLLASTFLSFPLGSGLWSCLSSEITTILWEIFSLQGKRYILVNETRNEDKKDKDHQILLEISSASPIQLVSS